MSRTTGGGNISGLINYMFREDKVMSQFKYQTRNGEFLPHSITHLLKGNSLREWASEFEHCRMQRKYKRKGAVELYHDVISFAKSDNHLIDDSLLTDITRQYIRRRTPNAPAVATYHTDTDHYHIHIAIAGVQYASGLANRVSKQDFACIKQEMEMYQQMYYPQLNNSRVEHGGYYKTKIKNRQKKHHEFVRKSIQNALDVSSTMEELKQLLNDARISFYDRGELKHYGVSYDGTKYRLTTLGFEKEINHLIKEESQLIELDAVRSTNQREVHIKSQRNLSSRLEAIDQMYNDYMNEIANTPRNEKSLSLEYDSHVDESLSLGKSYSEEREH